MTKQHAKIFVIVSAAILATGFVLHAARGTALDQARLGYAG